MNSPKAYAANTPYTTSIAISALAGDPARQQAGAHPDPGGHQHLVRQPGPDAGRHQRGGEQRRAAEHEAEAGPEDPAGHDQQEEDQLDAAGAGRDPAQDRVDRAEHAEDGQHPRVEAALADLGEHHRDDDRQQGEEQERRVDPGRVRPPAAAAARSASSAPRPRRAPRTDGGARGESRRRGSQHSSPGRPAGRRPRRPRSHGGPSTLVTCGREGRRLGDHPADRALGDDLAVGEHHDLVGRPGRTNSTSCVATSTACPSAARSRRMSASARFAA